MPPVPPGATEIVFDPHVAIALLCLLVALFVVLIVSLIPDDSTRRTR